MTRRLAVLISVLVGAAAATASGFVTYFGPANATVINSAIEIGSTAVVTIVNLFAPAPQLESKKA